MGNRDHIEGIAFQKDPEGGGGSLAFVPLPGPNPGVYSP